MITNTALRTKTKEIGMHADTCTHTRVSICINNVHKTHMPISINLLTVEKCIRYKDRVLQKYKLKATQPGHGHNVLLVVGGKGGLDSGLGGRKRGREEREAKEGGKAGGFAWATDDP